MRLKVLKTEILERLTDPRYLIRATLLLLVQMLPGLISMLVWESYFIGFFVFIVLSLAITNPFEYSSKLVQKVDLVVDKSLKNLQIPVNIKLMVISKFIFSLKTQKDTFEPIIADWQEEYFEALFKKEIWKARWINIRYTYAFIIAMWQKSPIGDLVEFVKKIAK